MAKIVKVTDHAEVFVPRYARLQEILNKHERGHWLPDEADMRTDVENWKSGAVSQQQKEHIKMILRFFTQADTNVCGGYVEKLLPVYKALDARMGLLSCASREVTHMLGYKRLNDTLGYDSEEFMEEFMKYDSMKAKHEFMVEKCDVRSHKGRLEYLAKQILMEGVTLFGSFALLLNYSRMNLLAGMVSVNQWSIIDESDHIDFLTELFRIDAAENPSAITEELKATIYQHARDVVKLECDCLDLCYSIYAPENMPIDDTKDYIKMICDYRMLQMGFKPQWNIEKNPYPFIEEITGNGVFGNFFESTITQYSKNPLVGDWQY